MRRNFLHAALAALIAFPQRLIARLRGGDVKATQWIEPASLATIAGEKPDLVIIDVRCPEEFAGPLGHISAAINISVDRLLQEPALLSPFRGSPIALVCHTDKRSAKAAEQLRADGFRQVFVLRGGMVRWNAERRPVAATALPPPA